MMFKSIVLVGKYQVIIDFGKRLTQKEGRLGCNTFDIIYSIGKLKIIHFRATPSFNRTIMFH